MKRSFVSASILLAGLAAAGCGWLPDGQAGWEPQWGVAQKADNGLCTPESDLCWSSEETDRMREVLRLERAVALGEVNAQAGVAELMDLVRIDFAYKLTDEERQALDAIGAGLEHRDPADVLAGIRTTALERLSAAYFAAYLVAAGRRAELEANGEELPADDAYAGPETFWGIEITEDMAECLAIMKQSGVLGYGYAILLELSGVLDTDYPVVTADTFGAYDPQQGRVVPAGPSREERANRMILKYSLYAGGVGVGVGLIKMIPIAGIPLSIAIEVCTLFPLHSRMVFAIAGAYGMDIRRDRNLLSAALIVVNGEVNLETVDMFAASRLAGIFDDAIQERMTVAGAAYAGGFISSVAVNQLIAFLKRRSQQAVGQTAAGESAGATGSRILGWAARGLSIVAAGITDWYITDKIGERASVSSRNWLHDLMLNGTAYLADPASRDCAFRTLGAMAWADGTITEREQKLFVALLAKPYYLGDERWYHLTPGERVGRSRDLRNLVWTDDTAEASLDCCEEQFEGLDYRRKIDLLSILYSMMHIDLEENGDERDFYLRLRDRLDGRGWFFDGPRVPEEQIRFVERYISMLLNPRLINHVADQPLPELEMIEPEDILAFLRKPDPAALRDFACGFGGSCD